MYEKMGLVLAYDIKVFNIFTPLMENYVPQKKHHGFELQRWENGVVFISYFM
jgi:hypothetical protein